MDRLVAWLTAALQVRWVQPRTTVLDRDDVMHEYGRHDQSVLLAQLAQGVLLQVCQAQQLPDAVVPTLGCPTSFPGVLLLFLLLYLAVQGAVLRSGETRAAVLGTGSQCTLGHDGCPSCPGMTKAPCSSALSW